MQSCVIYGFWSWFIIWMRRKVTLRMCNTSSLVVKVWFIFWICLMNYWMILWNILALNLHLLFIIFIFLSMRHSWLNSHCSFSWWRWRLSFKIILRIFSRFRPGFSQIKLIHRIIILVFNNFREFLFLILKFHL